MPIQLEPSEKTVENVDDVAETPESVRRAVEAACSRIRRAKDRYKDDFKRMMDNMDFDASLQWPGQKTMQTKKVVVNLTNKVVNQKVAALYARNPTVECKRRPRMDFTLWDEKLETAMNALAVPSPQSMALMADIQQGLHQRFMCEQVGKTLTYLLQYQWDEQEEEAGNFKLQMKQLVRRTVITGVGYARVSFSREVDNSLTSEGLGNKTVDIAKRAVELLQKVQSGEIDRSSEQMETLQVLVNSLGVTQTEDEMLLKERLIIDCPPSTSIIPDVRCRSLKGFIGAKWVAQEYIMPLDDINALFEVDLKVGQVKTYRPSGLEDKDATDRNSKDKTDKTALGCLWEVLDKTTRTHYFIVDGYCNYVMPPEPLQPSVRGFWPIRALTFNDVEVQDGCQASIFPPSDVQLMVDAQKEYNRTRDELKKHRKASGPGYIARKGMLTEPDKVGLAAQQPQALLELEGVPNDVALEKAFVARPTVAIDPNLYNDAPQLEDINRTTGMQEANLGSAPTKGTATGQTIAEQSRMTSTSSNVDDLDDFLEFIARVGGEMCLKEMQLDTVLRIVGSGAVWPTDPTTRADYVNQIYLTIKAASSGRPNKVVDINNWASIAPVLQASGANPQFMVRETLRRFDDTIDPAEAFPLVPPQPQVSMSTPNKPQVNPQDGVPQQHRPGPGDSSQWEQPQQIV